MVVAFAVAIMIPKGLTSVFRITCYTEQSFETAHFLMMEINPTDGDNYHLWRGVAQFLWQTILVFSMAVTLRRSQERKLQAAKLMICGVFLFELLFEVRARYTVTTTSSFTMTAAPNT